MGYIESSSNIDAVFYPSIRFPFILKTTIYNQFGQSLIYGVVQLTDTWMVFSAQQMAE